MEIFKNKLLIFTIIFLITLEAAFLSIKYINGFYFLIILGILFLMFVLRKTIYIFCLFVLLFWVPQGFNYLFLNSLLKYAFTAEVFIYGLVFMYIFFNGGSNKSLTINEFFKTPLAGFLLLFLLGTLIPYFALDISDKNYAYILFRKNCIYGPLVYMMAVNIVKNRDDAEKILMVLITTSMILSAFVFYSFYFGANVFEIITKEIIGGAFIIYGKDALAVGSTVLAGQVSTMIPMAVSFCLLPNKKYYKLVGILGFFILTITLVATFSRSAWAAATFGILIFIFLNARIKSKEPSLSRHTAIHTFIALSALFAVFFITVLWMANMNEQLVFRFKSIRYALEDMSFIERMQMWFSSFKIFLSYPLGVGFMPQYQLGDKTAYPHSLYLGTLLTSGFLGAFGLFGFSIKWVKKIYASLKTTENDCERMIFIGGIGCFSAFLFYNFFEASTFVPDIGMITIWIILGVLMGIRHNKRFQPHA